MKHWYTISKLKLKDPEEVSTDATIVDLKYPYIYIDSDQHEICVNINSVGNDVAIYYGKDESKVTVVIWMATKINGNPIKILCSLNEITITEFLKFICDIK